MKIGLIYVAFGDACDKLLAHTIRYSRKFTNLPILVLSNIPNRTPHWSGIENVEFMYFNMQIEDNRLIKTSMNQYAPFEYNIYMDADSIIQKEGFDETITNLIDRHEPDLLLNHFDEYPLKDGRFQNIYLRCLHQFGASMPLQIYNGAFIGFKKNQRTDEFFITWNKYWSEFGKEREMPPLACAINKHKDLKIARLPIGFFAPDEESKDAVIQHNYGRDFHSRIGCEPLQIRIAKYLPDDYSFTQL